MNFEDYKTNTKTIDLSNIAKNIAQLGMRYNINFNDIVKTNYSLSPKEYEIPCDNGKLVTKGLLKHKEVAVAYSTAIKDTKMESHIHEEIEIIKVISGEIHLKIDNEPLHILKKDDIIMIQAYVAHDCKFVTDSIFIAITLPACDTWPDTGV